MKSVFVTGGTVFVSRYVAEYYVEKGYEVYVLNRNHYPQSKGVTLIEGDRQDLQDLIRNLHFDIVLDINAYTDLDILKLLDAFGSFDTYIMISSSAVYPEFEKQPFMEYTPTGVNTYWGAYGLGKIAAEEALLKRVPNAYILRPPYLYGPMNNVYREAFVFDCAQQDRKFYVPKDGKMQLQFFHIHDLCRFMDIIIDKQPENHIFNVGNKETIRVQDWVSLCYHIVGKTANIVCVQPDVNPTDYFCFRDYEYYLDVQQQDAWMPDTIPLQEGLKEAYVWYAQHPEVVKKKPLMAFIDAHQHTWK